MVTARRELADMRESVSGVAGSAKHNSECIRAEEERTGREQLAATRARILKRGQRESESLMMTGIYVVACEERSEAKRTKLSWADEGFVTACESEWRFDFVGFGMVHFRVYVL